MKNLMIYINPSKSFTCADWGDETESLVKVQIDNSLELGWKKEDIMIVTNFEYEYRGIKTIIVGDDNYCEFSSGTPSKINTIITLFEKGLIEDETYWFHDFDAFQLEQFDKDELGSADIALTDYGITTISTGRNSRWSTGVLFFNNKSLDIFKLIKEVCYFYKSNEEVSLLAITKRGKYTKTSIKHKLDERIKKLDITHNFATRKRNIPEQYKITDLPIKVIHFHPYDKRPVCEGNNNMDVCVYGKNTINKVLVSDTLIKIFNKHNIK